MQIPGLFFIQKTSVKARSAPITAPRYPMIIPAISYFLLPNIRRFANVPTLRNTIA
jgi:hypothetical protein